MRCYVTKTPEDDDEEEAGGKKRKSRQLELSLLLKHVCNGLSADGVCEGAALPACVKTVEDHGYTLAFGIKVGGGHVLPGAACLPACCLLLASDALGLLRACCS